MKLRWAAPLAAFALVALMPAASRAQGTGTPPAPTKSPMGLGQNYPNPFNPETRIPFSVGDFPTCSDPARQYRVTLRVYNLLAQQVAVPVLVGGSGGAEGGRPIENMMLPCRQYVAYWDGKYGGTNREVASGIYLYRLEVDGRAVVKKMIVAK